MKEINVLSQGQILSEEINLNNKLVISFNNSSDYNIIEKQKVAFETNPSILKNKNNILTLPRDDIQELSKFQFFKHNLKSYGNIFSKNDLINIINFLNERDYREKDIIFQCEFGRSRSLTTAILLHEYYLKNTHKLVVDENKIRNKVIEKIIRNYFKK